MLKLGGTKIDVLGMAEILKAADKAKRRAFGAGIRYASVVQQINTPTEKEIDYLYEKWKDDEIAFSEKQLSVEIEEKEASQTDNPTPSIFEGLFNRESKSGL